MLTMKVNIKVKMKFNITACKKVSCFLLYLPPPTGKPWPGAVYNLKWCTDRQLH